MKQSEVEAHILFEKNYWYFVNKRALIKNIIIKCFSSKRLKSKIKILEIGPGSGTLLKELLNYGEVTGMDLNDDFLNQLKIKGIKTIKGKFPDNIPKNKFDLIIMSDCLEHIKQDDKAIKALFQLLNKKGAAIITVPAYNFLYSYHDKLLGHYRRYNKKSFLNCLKKSSSKFKISFFSYFNFYSLIPAYLVRKLIRPKSLKADTGSFDFNFVKKITSILNTLETNLIINGLNLPFGTSLLVVLKKE